MTAARLTLEKAFIDKLLLAIAEPNEETKHVAAEALRYLLSVAQEDALSKVQAAGETSISTGAS